MYPNRNGNPYQQQQQYPGGMYQGQGQPPQMCYPQQAQGPGYPPTSCPPAGAGPYYPQNNAGAQAQAQAAELRHAQEKLQLEKELLETQKNLVGMVLLAAASEEQDARYKNECSEDDDDCDSDGYSEDEDYYYDDNYEEIPSIVEGRFDAETDAKCLRKAMKGYGADEAAIINILARRTNEQRQEIAQAFKTSFGRNLIQDLKSELDGKLEDVVLALMEPHYEYLAKKLNRALRGIGNKESVLVDILCTSYNYEIEEINEAYSCLFNRSLESDLMGNTRGAFRKLLVSVNSAGRNEGAEPDRRLAEKDAHALYNAGEKKWFADEEAFNRVLATRNYAQIRLMLNEYARLTGNSFEKAIRQEFSGKIKNGLLAVVKSASNKAAYFAGRLHDSMAGPGTNDDDLIFLVVTRSEIDMENIKEEYKKKFHRTLAKDISSDCCGDYKRILLAMIGE